MNRKQKRQNRAEDFKNQKMKQASDFDFNQHGENHVSQQEVNFLRKGKGSLKDKLSALDAQKESGATFGKRAQGAYDRMTARSGRIDARQAAKAKAKAAKGSTGQQENPIDKTVTGENDAVPENKSAVMPDSDGAVNYRGGTPGFYDHQNNNTNIENTQEQEVNQDNDINTDVSGDNNTVITEQDNSIRQYGGDNRSFVYNHQGGAGSGSPVSAATMGGFYDVDDSPAANARFNDMYTTMNRDNQKRHAGEAMKTFAKYGNMDARDYTPEAMENALGRSTQYSFDRADRQTGHVFGDIWNENYITENWKMPTPPKAIESKAGEIADDAKDDIDDV